MPEQWYAAPTSYFTNPHAVHGHRDGIPVAPGSAVLDFELEPSRDTDGFLRLALTAEVNGEKVGEDLLSNMSWTFEEMTAYASRGTRVAPGDVLGSGTCGNGGCVTEHPDDHRIPGTEPVPLAAGRGRDRERS